MCEFLILILIEEMQFEEFKNFGKGPCILQHLRKLQKCSIAECLKCNHVFSRPPLLTIRTVPEECKAFPQAMKVVDRFAYH